MHFMWEWLSGELACLNKPVTHFPPGFSSILALLGLSGLDPLRGTRFINSLLFGANTFLLGIIGWRMTKSQLAGILLALLFLFNASMFRVHAVAMSEPLYIFFSLAAFITFTQYFSSLPSPIGRGERGEGWLILTAVLTALAYLTRYAGLALLATFVIALILLHDTWRKRLTSAGIFIAGFIPLVLAWSIRNKLARAMAAASRSGSQASATLDEPPVMLKPSSRAILPNIHSPVRT